MNKDALLASGIGFGIGLLITGAILVGPTIMSQLKSRTTSTGNVQSATQDNGNAQPTPVGSDSTTVTIDEPINETILTEDSVEIKGKAPQNSTIILSGDLDETVVTVDTSGTYAGKLTLKEGKNDISITSIQNGTPTVQKHLLFYTPES
jgi:hypothetical protein